MAANYVSLAFPMGESLSESDIEEVYNTGMDTGGLDFSGADLSGDQPYFIADLLSSNKMISIVHIDLSHTKITVEGFEAILFAAMEIKTLESFVGKSLSLPKEAGMSLSKLIASKGCLKILDVSQNDLGDVGLSNLSGAFSADHSKVMTKQLVSVVTLSVLDLSSNNLGDAGVLSLCRGLSQFIRRATSVGVTPALKVLLLHNNNITDKAAICLAQLINFRDNSITLGSNGGISPIPKAGVNNTLHLDELGLNDNPLTARGITALLGYASEGVVSPLKRLFLANTAVDVEVLELLGQNLLHNPNATLSHIDLCVNAQQAAELVQGTANLGTTNGSANTNNYHARRLYSALNQLCTAILQSNTALTIQLGFLHRTLYTQAVYLTHSRQDSAEIVRTLEMLNHSTVASVLGHAVVPNVAQWLCSAEYVYSEYSAAYSGAKQTQHSQIEVPPAVEYHQSYSNNENNSTSAYRNDILPMYTPSKAHFAFTTDSTHVTENANNYRTNDINTTDSVFDPTPVSVLEVDQSSDYPMPYPTTTATSKAEADEEEYEIETVLKQDARSLMSALRNLSPEGRAALAAPVVNPATSNMSAGAIDNDGTLTADSPGETTNNIASAAATPPVTASTTGIVPTAPLVQYTMPPTPAATTPGLTSPAVRKSNFLSTFHGGVLGLLAGAEPVMVPAVSVVSSAGSAIPVVGPAVVPAIESVVPVVTPAVLPGMYTVPSSASPTTTQSTVAAAPVTLTAFTSTVPVETVPPHQYASARGNNTHRTSPQTVSHSISNHTDSTEGNSNSRNSSPGVGAPTDYVSGSNNRSNSNPSPEIVGENEFYKLRSDHTVAMRNLSQEIDRLAHISPSTKLLMQSPDAVHAQNASISTPASVPKVEYTYTPEKDLYCVYQDANSTPTIMMQTNPAFDTSRVAIVSTKEESGTLTTNAAIPVDTNGGTSVTNAQTTNTPPSATHDNLTSTTAAAPMDETLIQIIGHLQAKINSLEASQTLYETSFINKFSALEYRIECMEQNMQSNSDVLKSIQEINMQVLERLGNNNTYISGVKNKEEKDAADDALETVHDSQPTTPLPPQSSSHAPVTPHMHYSPLPPSILNELVFTDLMARLEVVEDRLITDRAAAMQNVLHKQLHQERQQELSVMLGNTPGNTVGGGLNSYNNTMNSAMNSTMNASYNSTLNTMNTPGGSINMATVFGLHSSGRMNNGSSPLLAHAQTPYQPSNSAVQQGTPTPNITPVRSPFPASAPTGAVMFSPSAVPQVLPKHVGSPQTVNPVVYQPSGSQYSAVHQLTSPSGSTANTTVHTAAAPLNPYGPSTPYGQYMGNMDQPSPAQVFFPYTPHATSSSVPVPALVPGGVSQPGAVSMPIVQQVNPFTPKPAVYSSTEILQRPVHLHQQQQQPSYDPTYPQPQYQQHQLPHTSTSDPQDQYEDSLSQLAYQEKGHDHTHQGFEPALTHTNDYQPNHYTSNNYHDMADEHSQLTEPNDEMESVVEDGHVHYADGAVQTPYRTEPPHNQYNDTLSNAAMSHRRSAEGVAAEFSRANQPSYQNQPHASLPNHSNHPTHSSREGHFGLNDDHLVYKNEYRNHHEVGHLREETESRAIETLQRLQDNSARNSTALTYTHTSHVTRPPIRPVANDSLQSHSNSISKKTTTVSSLSAGSINSSKPTARITNPSNGTTNAKKNNPSRAVPSNSHTTDTVLLKHVTDRAHTSPHPVSAHKAVASAYIDAGYYQYDFEALSSPLITLDDRSVQSNATSDSMKYSIEPSSDVRVNQQNTPGYNRLISAHGNNIDPDTSMNYSIINNISRASMSMTDETLRDSVDLLRKDVSIQNQHTTRAEPNTRTTDRYKNGSGITATTNDTTLANYPHANNSSSAVGKSRSKSPHFMRPTTSHAFKAASNRPVEAKIGVEYR